MPKLRISELAIYPVKSMRQVPLEKATVELGGLKNDRRWMVVDTDGYMITQRQQSRLSLIQPELTDGGICLHTSGMPDLTVSVPDTDATRTVTVWNDSCNALHAGDHTDKWLSKFLGVECGLVYFPDDEVRSVDPAYAQQGDKTAFSDGFPILITTQSSLDDLNDRMRHSIPMKRFRPNIVVSGCGAFAEDEWKQLAIDDFILRVVKPCARCVIPSINIETGERSHDYEPSKTLSSYRRQGNKVIFGQNAVIDGEGELRVGMSVDVVD